MSERMLPETAVQPPKQQRSRASLQRILVAARGLLASRDHRDVTLRLIAEEAGVSQSSLFARFRTKEALLDHLHEETCKERRELAYRSIAELDGRDVGIPTLVHSLMRTFVDHLRKDGALVRSLFRAGSQFPTIRKREHELRRGIAEKARDAVLRRLPPEKREPAASVIDSQISLLMTSTPQILSDAPATLLGDGLSDYELSKRIADLALRAARPDTPDA